MTAEGDGYRKQLSLLRSIVAEARSLSERLPDVSELYICLCWHGNKGDIDTNYLGRSSDDGKEPEIVSCLRDAKVLVNCGLQKLQRALAEAEAISADGDLFVPLEPEYGSPAWNAGYAVGAAGPPRCFDNPPFDATDHQNIVSWYDGWSDGQAHWRGDKP